jgi:hypothetical protein
MTEKLSMARIDRIRKSPRTPLRQVAKRTGKRLAQAAVAARLDGDTIDSTSS